MPAQCSLLLSYLDRCRPLDLAANDQDIKLARTFTAILLGLFFVTAGMGSFYIVRWTVAGAAVFLLALCILVLLVICKFCLHSVRRLSTYMHALARKHATRTWHTCSYTRARHTHIHWVLSTTALSPFLQLHQYAGKLYDHHLLCRAVLHKHAKRRLRLHDGELFGAATHGGHSGPRQTARLVLVRHGAVSSGRNEHTARHRPFRSSPSPTNHHKYGITTSAYLQHCVVLLLLYVDHTEL